MTAPDRAKALELALIESEAGGLADAVMGLEAEPGEVAVDGGGG